MKKLLLLALPVVSPALPMLAANPYHFAVTATKDGLESDYSAEAVHAYPYHKRTATLMWDPVPGCTYTVHRGLVAGVYTDAYNAGTNLTLTVQLYPAVATNTVLAVSGATSLFWATNASGPWVSLGTNYYTVSNAPSPVFFRAKGATISRQWKF